MTGSSLLQALLRARCYSQVTALVRRPLAVSNPHLKTAIIDFDKISDFGYVIRGDDVFCTIGTTIRHAGSKEAFRRIDFEYPLEIAKTAALNGAQKFMLVSSVGANPNSKYFYLTVKGDLERELAKLSYGALHLFRPGMLIGNRQNPRLREEAGIVLAKIISPLLQGSWRRYRSVRADDLAQAMIASAASDKGGVHTYDSYQINTLAAETRLASGNSWFNLGE